MPFFAALTKADQLPKVGDAIERGVMDWKAPGAVGATPFHKAKDVAAFSNHLGGVILAGACESGGHLATYEGMTAHETSAMQKAFSQSVEQKCQPAPTIEFERFEAPGGPGKYILAVNVWPSLLLVGVKIEAHRPSEGYGGVSFVYPVRVGIDAKYLEPSEIAMYMTPQVRRVVVLLSRIPPGTVLRIFELGAQPSAAQPSNTYLAQLVAVDEDANIVRVRTPSRTYERGRRSAEVPAREHGIPLDCVNTVYETSDAGPNTTSEWRLYFQHSR